MKNNEYTCDLCGNTYEKSWSDEEAQKEAEELWTQEELASGTSIVCDDCFNKIMA